MVFCRVDSPCGSICWIRSTIVESVCLTLSGRSFATSSSLSKQSFASLLHSSNFPLSGSTSLAASSHFFSLHFWIASAQPSKTALPALNALSPCSLRKRPALIHLPPYLSMVSSIFFLYSSNFPLYSSTVSLTLLTRSFAWST